MDIELKNCPFCGNEAVTIKVKPSDKLRHRSLGGDSSSDYYMVGCQADFEKSTGCHIFKSDWSEQKAADKWNKRVNQ